MELKMYAPLGTSAITKAATKAVAKKKAKKKGKPLKYKQEKAKNDLGGFRLGEKKDRYDV
jgi:hypothetical protein